MADHGQRGDEQAGDGLRIFGAEPVTESHRAVHWPDEGPSWAAVDEPPEAIVTDDGPTTMALPIVLDDASDDDHSIEVVELATGETPELQHWSEPPTGSMPAVFDQDEASGGSSASHEAGDDADWSVITGSAPRFRSGDGDWDDDGFADELAEAAAADPDMQGGALGERESDPTESDEEFAAAAAQKRSGSRDIETPRRAPKPARPAVRASAGPDPASPSGRNLPVALATAALLAAVAIACFVAGEGLTALLAATILGAAGAELVSTLRRKNLATAHLIVIAGSASMPLAAWWRGPLGVAVVTGIVVMTTLLWFLFEAGPGRPLIGSAMTLFAFAWIGGLGAFAGLLLDQEQGVEWLLAALIPTICYDVFGYFCGQQFGRTPLAPKVSPNKTLEGTVFGVLLGLVITAAILTKFLDPFDGHATWGVLIGLGAPLAALVGDLCQSMIKRDLGIKDFSATLPGHGGILDRFDGLLFALPTVYFLMLHFVTP